MALQFRLRTLALAVAVIAVLLWGFLAWRRVHQTNQVWDPDLLITGVRSFDVPPGP
jgi:hypothetical protein